MSSSGTTEGSGAGDELSIVDLTRELRGIADKYPQGFILARSVGDVVDALIDHGLDVAGVPRMPEGSQRTLWGVPVRVDPTMPPGVIELRQPIDLMLAEGRYGDWSITRILDKALADEAAAKWGPPDAIA